MGTDQYNRHPGNGTLRIGQDRTNCGLRTEDQGLEDQGPDRLPRMNVREATRSYERWLSKQTSVVKSDLEEKHAKMDRSAFEFLRATFYRWVQLWPVECPELADAPALLGIGDLHLENFGTWRDSEGRLIWGINDLDEAHPVAYTSDRRPACDQRRAGHCGSGELRVIGADGLRRDSRGLRRRHRSRRPARSSSPSAGAGSAASRFGSWRTLGHFWKEFTSADTARGQVCRTMRCARCCPRV